MKRFGEFLGKFCVESLFPVQTVCKIAPESHEPVGFVPELLAGDLFFAGRGGLARVISIAFLHGAGEQFKLVVPKGN